MTQTVYMGPNIATTDLRLSHGTIFSGALPDSVMIRRNADPYFSALLVPVERVAKVRADLRAGGTHIANCYSRVSAMARK